MRKSQGYFVGGRRGFGFNVVGSKKVANQKEQKIVQEMKKKKASGESMLAIHRWLNDEMKIKLFLPQEITDSRKRLKLISLF